MIVVRRRIFQGRRVGLAADGSGAWICAGDFVDAAPRHDWASVIAATCEPVQIHRQTYLPFQSVSHWPNYLRHHAHSQVASGVEKLLAWVSQEMEVLQQEVARCG